MSEKPSGRHEDVFYFIKNYMAENGIAPSVRDVAGFLKSSKRRARKYIDALESKGYITLRCFAARSIRLCHGEEGHASKQGTENNDEAGMSEGPMGRHKDVFYFIKNYMAENDVAPSVRDVAAFLESSTSLAQWYLDALEDRGYITRERFVHRSIELCRSEYEDAQQQ